jgi:hypothetical protein
MTPCSFAPIAGVDIYDALLVRDVEEFVLQEQLDFPTDRLAIYSDSRDVDPIEYLRSRGFFHDDKQTWPQDLESDLKWIKFALILPL